MSVIDKTGHLGSKMNPRMKQIVLTTGLVKWWNGEMVKWWNGEMVKWWNGEMVKWWNGEMVKWWNGEMVKWWKKLSAER